MTVADQKKPPPRIVVPLRVSPTGKARWIEAAKAAGYDHYTAWMRDVLAAEAVAPRHKPKPKP